LILVLALFTFPILYLFLVSLKSQGEILSGGLLPESPTLDNWSDAYGAVPLMRFLRNSVIVGATSVLLTLLIAVPATYAMVRFRTGGRFLPGFVLSTYVMPPIVVILPLFFLVKWAGLIDTLPGLAIVDALVNVPVAVWLLESFVRGVPREIEEAAWVDGCGRFSALIRIVVPLISPGIVAAGIICFILTYNEFLFAVILTYGPEAQPLTVGVSLFQGDKEVQYGQMAAASLTGMVPVYILALFFQRWLIRGITAGGVK
jgi:multiple sugar transport system permease protein